MNPLHAIAASIGAATDPINLALSLILGLAASSTRVGGALGAGGGALSALIYVQASQSLNVAAQPEVVIGTLAACTVMTLAVAALKFLLLKKRG